MKEWLINNLNWLIPLIITVIFAWLNIRIAKLSYQCIKKQKEIQNDSFCYQLFDKRLKIYYSILEILNELKSSTDNANTLLQPFRHKTHDVPFLFGKDIENHCEEMDNIILGLKLISDSRKNPCISDNETLRLSNKETELQERTLNYIKDLPKIFQPYIGFAKYQITPEPSSKKQ